MKSVTSLPPSNQKPKLKSGWRACVFSNRLSNIFLTMERRAHILTNSATHSSPEIHEFTFHLYNIQLKIQVFNNTQQPNSKSKTWFSKSNLNFKQL